MLAHSPNRRFRWMPLGLPGLRVGQATMRRPGANGGCRRAAHPSHLHPSVLVETAWLRPTFQILPPSHPLNGTTATSFATPRLPRLNTTQSQLLHVELQTIPEVFVF